MDDEGGVRLGLYLLLIGMHLQKLGPAVKIFYHSAFDQDYQLITGLTKGCPDGRALSCLHDIYHLCLQYLHVLDFRTAILLVGSFSRAQQVTVDNLFTI